MALREFHKLRTKPRRENWYWDFHTYIVDNHIEMAYIDTRVPYDVNVSFKYYVNWTNYTLLEKKEVNMDFSNMILRGIEAAVIIVDLIYVI